MHSVTILVDVQNIYYTCREAYQRNFDYNAFWRQVSAERNVVKAIAYAIDRGDEKQRQFQNILRAIGFEVKLKPFIQRADGSFALNPDEVLAADKKLWETIWHRHPGAEAPWRDSHSPLFFSTDGWRPRLFTLRLRNHSLLFLF